MKAVNVISGTGLPLKRSDVDTDQIIPAEWLKRVERTGLREGAVRHVARRSRLRAQRRALRRRVDARRRAGVRRRVVARARRLGDPAVRVRRRDRAELLGHLPQQLHQERPRARDRRRGGRRAHLGAIDDDPETEIVVDVERLSSRCRRSGSSSRSRWTRPTQHRFLDGLDDIGITLGHAAAIDDFEDAGRAGPADRSGSDLPWEATVTGSQNRSSEPTSRAPLRRR